MLPGLSNIPSQSSVTVESFGGINLMSDYRVGELSDCVNMDLSDQPALSVRKARKLLSECRGVINGTGSHNGFFYTFFTDNPSGIFLFYNGEEYEFTSCSTSSDYTLKRKFASLEGSILIIPDNVVFYTETKDFKRACKLSHTDYSLANQKYHMESRESKNLYTSSASLLGRIYHNKIESDCVKYQPGGSVNYDFYPVSFSEDFEAGDVVNIKMKVYSPGSEASEELTKLTEMFAGGVNAKIKSLVRKNHTLPFGGSTQDTVSLVFDNNTFAVGSFADLVFSEITIEKKIPALSDIASFNNRVWGISGNRICTSKLGDADEWNDFSVDSYGTLPSSCFSATAGTDGDFTAVIPFGNYIYAFKENYIHKVYGDSADKYAISNIPSPGCIAGADSLAVCGGHLVYSSHDGIYLLRDGYPVHISRKIGIIFPLCAASFAEKYYVIAKNGAEKVLWVYDLKKDAWTKQSCRADADNLHSDASGICYSEGGKLIGIDTSDSACEYERNIPWSFRVRFDENGFSKNTAIRALARINLEKNASFTARAIYDDDTRGAPCGFSFDETKNGCATLRLPVKRDLGFVLEFRGVGGFVLSNLKFCYYKGNEY